MMTGVPVKDARAWIEASRYDLATAQAMLGARRYLYVLFMCQQSLEKLLKACVIARRGVFPPRIHDLLRLEGVAEMGLSAEEKAFPGAVVVVLFTEPLSAGDHGPCEKDGPEGGIRSPRQGGRRCLQRPHRDPPAPGVRRGPSSGDVSEAGGGSRSRTAPRVHDRLRREDRRSIRSGASLTEGIECKRHSVRSWSICGTSPRRTGAPAGSPGSNLRCGIGCCAVGAAPSPPQIRSERTCPTSMSCHGSRKRREGGGIGRTARKSPSSYRSASGRSFIEIDPTQISDRYSWWLRMWRGARISRVP